MGATLSSQINPLGKYVNPEELRELSVPQDTLFAILQPQLISMEDLHARGWTPALKMVELLLGVQPTCDMVLEIWPPAFHAYNVIVPNCLNLPELLFGFGTQPVNLVPLAMYSSSRAARCSYCTAHTCSFAVRRGVSAELLKALSEGGNEKGLTGLTEQEQAVVTVSRNLGRIPCQIKREDVDALTAALTPADCEWVVAAATMFGAFNKLMDALGVPLEPDTVAETRDLMGGDWTAGSAGQMVPAEQLSTPAPATDSLWVKAQAMFIGLKPGGLAALDAKLVEGIPKVGAEASEFLKQKFGFEFPVLRKLSHSKFIVAVAQTINLNFDESKSAGLTLKRKVLAGILFCTLIGDEPLRNELQVVATHFGVAEAEIKGVSSGVCQNTTDSVTDLMLKITSAISSSPVQMTSELVNEIRRNPEFDAPKIVELVSFIAACQMLHRLEAYFQF